MRARVSAILLSLAVAAGVVSAAPAYALSAGDHRNRTMVDTDTPVYVGYDSTLKAYHFRVTGRWRAVCGASQYCWPVITGAIGSKDSVGIHFAGPMQIKKQMVRGWNGCGKLVTTSTSTRVTGGFFDYYAGLNDTVYEESRKWGGIAGSGSNGTCFSSTLPQVTVYGGGAWVTRWLDIPVRSYAYDVWVNPTPTYGSCFTSMTVKGEYTHTWGTQALSFALGYPWGVGVGVVDGTADFEAYQDGDGYADSDLRTGKLCRH